MPKMKRSEMQMVILRTLGRMDFTYPDGYGYEELSDEILKDIEKAGMLPPPIEGLVQIEEVDGELFIPFSKWEDENETNS